MKTAHAILSPSGAERWMTCPGSVALEAQCPGETNEYADEGTAAHALASMCLTMNNDPAAYAGRVFSIVNSVYWPGGDAPRPPKLRKWAWDVANDFTVDDSMIENVRTYVNSIREYAMLGVLHIEQRVPIDHITGEQDAQGTSDAVIECIEQRELQVHDLKYGMGVQVFAERNPQLMIYAAGALAKFPGGDLYDNVRLVIHQPRLAHLDEWVCPVTTLLAWVANEAKPKAFHAMATLSEHPDAVRSHLHASEAACRFCKAKATCPELARTVSEAVFGDFDSIDQPMSPTDKIMEPLINKSLEILAGDPTKLSIRMGKVEMVEDWCKAVRAKTDLTLRNGEKVIGWKLVIGKKGNRKWGDENAAIKLMKAMRLKITEMYTMKVLTPTKAEAFFKATPKRWAQLVSLITQEPGNAHVAPESDTRPAYIVPNAADDFAASDGSDLV